MSIRSVGSLALAFSSAAAPMDDRAEQHSTRSDPVAPAQAELSAVSILTTEDRDVIAAMFGPNALLGSGQAADDAADFVAILLADRASGRLPAGVEVTSTYLRGVWDQFPSYAGPGAVSRPLTRKNVADGLFFLGRRSLGGLVDVRA